MAEEKDQALGINKAQLILAERRTHLAALRTGIAVLALPMGVVSFLIAVSEHFSVAKNVHYLIPLLALSAGLVLLGIYLIAHAAIRLRRTRILLEQLEQKYNLIAELLE